MQQTTIKHSCTFTGIGIHNGQEVTCTARPAPAHTGIVFDIHTDTGVCRLQPTPHAVKTTALATTLSTIYQDKTVHISTVEHLLAAIRGLQIDNIIIDVQGHEIPIMDGSAASFTTRLQESGIHTLFASRRVLRVNRPVELHDGTKYLRATPYKGFHVNYTITFPHPLIGTQSLSLDINPTSFESIAFARTFGFLKDVETLRTMGLALGGSLDNAIVLDENKVLNAEGLRSPDEFIRHKILDFIGDMAVLQAPLQGAFDIVCSGHQFNNLFLRKLHDDGALSVIDLADEDRMNSKKSKNATYAKRTPAPSFALA